MSNFFDSAANQQRTRMLVMNATSVVTHPEIDRMLETVGSRTPELGWGGKEYRSGQSCLRTTPSVEGESAAEISYYPEIGKIGLDGALYIHGEGSIALGRLGEIVSMHFNDEAVDGYYPNYMGIYQRPSGLVVGNFNRVTEDIDPVTNDVFNANEAGLQTLLDYTRTL